MAVLGFRPTATLHLIALPAALIAVLSGGCSVAAHTPGATIRIGYLANITQVQALMAVVGGQFEHSVGPTEMEGFNSGPEAIDAITAGALDAAYIGPVAAINAFFRTGGEAVAIVAGSASGGSRLMVSRDSGIFAAADFAHRTVATPGLANTQDIALRSWLSANGLFPKEKGGTVSVRPMSNPDIYQLMMRGKLDAAWLPEPWASRVEVDAGARTLIDERSLWPDSQFASVVLVVSRRLINADPSAVQRLVNAHADLTRIATENPKAALDAANAGLAARLGKPLDPEVLTTASSYFEITMNPLTPTIEVMATRLSELGLVEPPPAIALDSLFDFSFFAARTSA